MTGDLVYFWIQLPDAARAETFYGALLGWEFTPGNVPEGRQVTNTSPPAGLEGGAGEGIVQVCFEVDDIEAAVARVRELGGEAEEPQEIESGRFAVCRDDQGTQFNLWTSAGG